MAAIMSVVRRYYGARPLHLLALTTCFAFVGYVVAVIGPKTLWNTQVWWQSILVWFLGAIIAHDLLLFPLYSLADRSLRAGLRAVRGRTPAPSPKVPPLNYIRVPTMGCGLLFLLFFPGIVRQGQATYLAATGQNQQPFLDRWLLLTALMFGLSAVVYAARVSILAKHEPTQPKSTSESSTESRERSP
ncbi:MULTISPECIES: hypothetical protein [Nocardia]|uniref:hypothetical protein n=1 Tax=Nocardia TaxID=1817 RepID=UPI0002E650D2|nr:MULTISPECIES: hypothetical protein [Nocardia]